METKKKVKRHLREEIVVALLLLAFIATGMGCYFMYEGFKTFLHEKIGELPVTVAIPSPKGDMIQVEKEIVEEISYVCCLKSIPPELGIAIAYKESALNTETMSASVSNDSSYGIMGLNSDFIPYFCEMYGDGKDLSPDTLEGNIYLGVSLLSDLYHNYYNEDIYQTIAAYNLGPNGWARMQEKGQQEYLYADAVILHMKKIEEHFNP